MPFTLDDLLNLHPHEVVNLINRYREALEFYSIRGNQRENDQGGIARAAIAYKP